MPVNMDRYRKPIRMGAPCLIGRMLDRLDTKLADDLRTLIEAHDVPYSRIEQYSEEDFGTQIPAGTASRHRRGVCKCDR